MCNDCRKYVTGWVTFNCTFALKVCGTIFSYHGTMLPQKGIVADSDSMCAEAHEIVVYLKQI